MSLITKFLILGVLTAGITVYFCPSLLKEPEPLKIPENQYWGRGKLPLDESKIPADNMEIVPFQVNVPDTVIQDLQKRLQNTRFVEPLEGVQFQYGFNAKYLKEIVNYWTKTYNWTKEQQYLNQFSQFTTQIEGIKVHFLHVKPKATKDKVRILPLMLIHGWPGSVLEYYKSIPLLTTPKDGIAFEIICPSLPGYGFSEAPHHPGFTTMAAARIFSKLMKRLGHNQFYVQGGDWGSIIAANMGTYYPERLHGIHVNMVLIRPDLVSIIKLIVGAWFPSLILDSNEKTNVIPIVPFFIKMLRESGYFHFQATKPDTVGSALNDSPAGLAAYILEKMSLWTDMKNIELTDGGLTKKYTLDELLTNIMIYWVTNSIASSQRFYKENFATLELMGTIDRPFIKVPAGVAVFPNEIVAPPRSIVKRRFTNLVSYTSMPRGGHFGAFEEPQLLADDVRLFVSKNEALKNVKK